MSAAQIHGSDSNTLVCDACWNSIFSFDAWQTVIAATDQPEVNINRLWGYSKGYCYNTTWEAIHASASAGCSWCQLLARPSYNHGSAQIWVAYDKDSECTPAGTKQLTVKVEGSEGGTFSFQHYYMYTDADNKAAPFVAARDRVLDVASPSSYKLALECIESCELLHKSCPISTPQTLPDRVIDCSDPDRPYIIITGGNRRGRYIALSYIWGGPQPLTTTQNIATYVKYGLEILHFPKTIREAILATNRLGIRFLWIDALCILQDSDEDKLMQIRMMAKIYRNSFLTLIAACGNNVNEGFLYQDRPQKVPDARIPYRCPDGRIGSVWIAAVLDARSEDASRSYYDELEPVNHRGWCLQERLLSPRCLIYASHTLQYYCQTETANIGHALCEPSTSLRLPNTLLWPSSAKQLLPMSSSDQVRARQAWLSVIFDYTNRNISLPGDKLVALAGIVEEFHRVYNTEYVAGLWRKTLLLDLLWKRSSAYEIKPRPTNYRAPSWSWASIDGLVEYQYVKEKTAKANGTIESEILSCHVSLASEDMPFGAVSAATLTLLSHIRQAKLESKSKSGHVSVELDSEAEPINVAWVDIDAMEEKDEVWLIPLIWDKEGASVEGLILAAASNCENCFRRVGHFTNLFGSRDTRWIENAPKQIINLV